MSLEYKIISYNTKALPLLWEENWNLNCIYDWMMFFSREVKKQVKSRALVAESNKSISYLKKQREQIDNWQPIHIPDFVNNESEWIKFVLHWIQKNSEELSPEFFDIISYSANCSDCALISSVSSK